MKGRKKGVAYFAFECDEREKFGLTFTMNKEHEEGGLGLRFEWRGRRFFSLHLFFSGVNYTRLFGVCYYMTDRL